jgi:hypothetical protein
MCESCTEEREKENFKTVQGAIVVVFFGRKI